MLPDMLLGRRHAKPKIAGNPVFWPDEMLRVAGLERFERARSNPDSVELLVWNVFQSLETHADPPWLAYRLEVVGGAGLRPPLRIALWTGRDREPLLRSADGTPVEVPVRIETPDIVALVTTASPADLRAEGLVRLIDAGLDHARRLGKQLAAGVVFEAGTPVGSAWTERLCELRDAERLAEALPHRKELPPVALHEASWQQLLETFEAELDYLRLGGQPVRAFLDHCRARRLL